MNFNLYINRTISKLELEDDFFKDFSLKFLSKKHISDFGLFPSEIEARDSFKHPSRRISYQNGRIALRIASRNFDASFDPNKLCQPFPLVKNISSKLKAPILPRPLIGNISHSGYLATAVVSSEHLLKSIAVDIQFLKDNSSNPSVHKLLKKLSSEREQKQMKYKAPIVTFSHKESVFKCCALTNIDIKSWKSIFIEQEDNLLKTFKPVRFSASIDGAKGLKIYGISLLVSNESTKKVNSTEKSHLFSYKPTFVISISKILKYKKS